MEYDCFYNFETRLAFIQHQFSVKSNKSKHSTEKSFLTHLALLLMLFLGLLIFLFIFAVKPLPRVFGVTSDDNISANLDATDGTRCLWRESRRLPHWAAFRLPQFLDKFLAFTESNTLPLYLPAECLCWYVRWRFFMKVLSKIS